MIKDIFSELPDFISAVQDNFNSYQQKFFTARTPEFFCLELNGEAGELANLEKKKWKGREVEQERFEDEAADVFIALMNYSNARNINLGKAVYSKLQAIEQKRCELEAKGESY